MVQLDHPRVKHATQESCFPDGQKKSLRLRREVQHLYFNAKYSMDEISRLLNVSKGFVVSWTRSAAQDTEQDKRGWRKKRGRVWGDEVRDRIQAIHTELQKDERQFFSGATAIQQCYQARYPNEDLPPLRTIGRMLKEMGLSQPPRPKAKGASRYLCYPEYTVYETLGKRVLEADFIGKKYLAGQREPVNFIGFSFKKAPKLRYFQRVEAQNTQAVITASTAFFKQFEYPDVMKVDNDPATIGSGSGQRTLSRFMVFLLKHRIIPVFSVPRKPFSQASIEGNNSVFSRKFWNTQHFTGLQDLDTRLGWFNDSSLLYTGYDVNKRRRRTSKKDFVPKVYFIRQVKGDEATGKGYIDVLNEVVAVRKTYINYFVLAEWNLNEQRLNVLFEKDRQTRVINSVDFEINPNSKYRLQ